MSIQPFHLAIPVSDLQVSRQFYGEVLNVKEGRSSSHWVDFDFFGHQFVIHEVKNYKPHNYYNSVDKHDVPVPHFGVVLKWEDFWSLNENLKSHDIKFEIEPYIRFEGKPGEQATMFFFDPSGNALEFKSFKDPKQLFSTSL
jgi:extradiol dioxygenase family protein